MGASINAEDRQKVSEMIGAALASGASALDEWQSKAVFRAYGIPVPEGEMVKTEAEAVAAAERIGGKVVMKGIAAEIHHKTEAGLVVLGVEGAQAAGDTYRLLQQRAEGKLEVGHSGADDRRQP